MTKPSVTILQHFTLLCAEIQGVLNPDLAILTQFGNLKVGCGVTWRVKGRSQKRGIRRDGGTTDASKVEGGCRLRYMRPFSHSYASREVMVECLRVQKFGILEEDAGEGLR